MKKQAGSNTTINVGGENSANNVTSVGDVTLGQINFKWPFRRKQAKSAAAAQTDQSMQLFEALRTSFTFEEIENICYELGIVGDELPARTRSGKARQLVEAADARKSLDKLESIIKRERPE